MSEKFDIINRHRQECDSVYRLIYEALQFYGVDLKKSTKMMKRAKAAAETLAVKQDAERRAYGLDKPTDLVQLCKAELARRMLLDKKNGKTFERPMV